MIVYNNEIIINGGINSWPVSLCDLSRLSSIKEWIEVGEVSTMPEIIAVMHESDKVINLKSIKVIIENGEDKRWTTENYGQPWVWI